MEFPTLGKHCFERSCKQLDFLPMKCDACSEVFCKDHIQYSQHQCNAAYQKDVQVPVCPLCNKPIPVKRGEPPDIGVSQHIDTDCQSDPAKEKRRVFSNKCSLKGCKQKELVPVLCSSCHQNFCLRHRHTTDHDCKGFQNSGRAVSHQAVAAMNRAAKSSSAGSKKPQQTSLTSIGSDLDRVRRDRAAHQFQHGTPPASASLQAGMSEDEAMSRAIQMSLSGQPASQHDSSRQQDQEAADRALAQALQDSEKEEHQRRRQQQEQPRARRQRSEDSKCHVV